MPEIRLRLKREPVIDDVVTTLIDIGFTKKDILDHEGGKVYGSFMKRWVEGDPFFHLINVNYRTGSAVQFPTSLGEDHERVKALFIVESSEPFAQELQEIEKVLKDKYASLLLEE